MTFGRPGSALLVNTRRWDGFLIEEGTQGPWGHVAICDGTGWVFQAMPRGFDVVTESSYLKNNLTARVDVPLTDAQRAAAMEWCEQQVQRRTRYNWPAIFVFPLRTIRADVWLGPAYRRLARWAQNRDALICSESWVNMLAAVGFDTTSLFGTDMSSEISPNRIGLVAATQALYYRLEEAT